VADVARAERAPLIVMGLGRRRPIDRLLGGETTLRTVQRASCPVLAVGPELGPPFRAVVIATDFSAESAFAAECAVPLLALDAEIHLVHVWQRTAFQDTPLRAADERYVRALPARFHRLRELLALPETVTMHEEVREGHAAERLLDYATARGADLIVAGRQGLNMFSRFLVGSVSGSLLRGAQCSVLIAPEPTFVDLDRLHRRLDGASESHRPAEWMVQLDEFSRRNVGRRTMVEVIDATIGAQVLESGFALQGATYDPSDRRVELMLGNGEPSMHHVTRAIGNVESVTIATDAHGCDLGMSIAHGTGQTVLTFWGSTSV
jgi:nucleotide-binding universal stress UspA family protein